MKITAAIAAGLVLAIPAAASAQDFKPIHSPQVVKAPRTSMGITHEDMVVPAGCTTKFAKLTPYAKKIGVVSIRVYSCAPTGFAALRSERNQHGGHAPPVATKAPPLTKQERGGYTLTANHSVRGGHAL